MKQIPAITLGVVLAASACTDQQQVDPDDFPTYSSTVHVTYEVYGTASGVSLTVQEPQGQTQVDADLPLTSKSGTPMSGLDYTFSRGEFLYISAQNSGEAGNVECNIKVDGKVISHSSSSIAYGIASCDGSS